MNMPEVISAFGVGIILGTASSPPAIRQESIPIECVNPLRGGLRGGEKSTDPPLQDFFGPVCLFPSLARGLSLSVSLCLSPFCFIFCLIFPVREGSSEVQMGWFAGERETQCFSLPSLGDLPLRAGLAISEKCSFRR